MLVVEPLSGRSLVMSALEGDGLGLRCAQDLVDGVEGHMHGAVSSEVWQRQKRPFVTLSWAQGLDGSMAHASSSTTERLLLSGSESFAMTHGLRGVHDAICVGRGTVSGDDPRLTVRLTASGAPVDASATTPPTAVVVDGALNTPPGCALLGQTASSGRRVVVATSGDATVVVAPGRSSRVDGFGWSAEKASRAGALLVAGATLLVTPPAEDGTIDLRVCLEALTSECGVRAVFVEGGANVVDAFLRAPHLVDEVVVTIAPVFVGGLRPLMSPLDGTRRLQGVQTLALGSDVVIRGQLRQPEAYSSKA